MNSISAHKYIKLSLLRAYVSTHKFDVIVYLKLILTLNIYVDENLEIVGYTLIRADHPSKNKRGGVCIYYKQSLPFRSLDINCQKPRGVKLLTRLRLGLSHLRERKFKYGFQDTLNPICSCGNDIETSTHFLLYCPHYSNKRSTFLNTIRNINRNIFNKNDLQITENLPSLW